jgi:signal transduction histidine kinase/DNA-binding response OmpR family regulator
MSESPLPLAPAEPVCNILIVDDEPSNLLALEAILEPLKQKIVRANSGVEALRHALKTEFCVVLLDVQMPEMDGLETAELLRKRPKTRDVPVIFLTAINKDSEWVTRGYSAGAVDYLFKPYDPDTLRTKVATFVELGKKNMALRIGGQRELADFKRWSERKYEDLADSIPQIVWTADEHGQLTYRNKRWLEIAGNMDGFSALVHAEDLGAFITGWESAVNTEMPWEAELRIGLRFHLVRAVPRRDEKGRVIGWIGTATDIDARVKADRSLRLLADASQRLNRSLGGDPFGPRGKLDLDLVLANALSILGDGAILDVQPDGANPRERVRVAGEGIDAARFDDPRFDLGPSTVGYSGRPEVFLDVKQQESERNPNPSGRGAELLRFLGELGVGAYICVPLITRDRTIGSLSFVRLDGRGTFEEADVALAGDLARRIAVAIDNARLHETTERRREELEQANRSKDLFLATLSHELRTPLNAIVGWTDMMRKGQLAGDELKHAMETIDRNALAMSGLVGDLLDVSRIVTGTLKIETKLVKLASILDAVVSAAKPLAAAKEITLDVATATERGLQGDSGRLRQVFGNLLNNAIKFTPSGGTVSLGVQDGPEGSVRVVVSDTGEGIAPEFLPHVFERFRQAETARTRGLGLGLAIVKHLVEEHGGTVLAASEGRGKGAAFTVELPVVAESAEAISEETAAIPESSEPDLTGVRVLIVEDDPDGNELICTILQRYGARVTSATTAAGALEVLALEHPQVLVSDIGLPDMDGMELIRAVRSRAEIAEIPAVALTAYASRQDASKAIGAGFDAHVAKPVQPLTLGSAVARVLTRGKPVRRSTAA